MRRCSWSCYAIPSPERRWNRELLDPCTYNTVLHMRCMIDILQEWVEDNALEVDAPGPRSIIKRRQLSQAIEDKRDISPKAGTEVDGAPGPVGAQVVAHPPTAPSVNYVAVKGAGLDASV